MTRSIIRWTLGVTHLILANALLATASKQVAAQPTVTVGTHRGDYSISRYGGGMWQGITARLDAAFGSAGLATRTDLSDLDDLLSRDRLWLDQRQNDVLSPTEFANVAAFLATGRRAVLIGEHSQPGHGWEAWNLQLASLVGGSFGPGTSANVEGFTASVGSHELTTGVSSVYLSFGRTVAGGTPLFAQSFATLWGPNQHILTVFDTGVWDDNHLPLADDARFATNVVNWLVTPVPEPSTLALVLPVMIAGAVAHRRRSRRFRRML